MITGIIIGIVIGMLVATLMFSILAFFDAGNKIRVIKTKVAKAGPKPTGAIFEPQSDVDMIREEYIKKEKSLGHDVPLTDLINKQ